MRWKVEYTKPTLRAIDPTEARWRDYLPRARELTHRALIEVEDAGVPDVASKLKELLDLIDREIAAAEGPHLA